MSHDSLWHCLASALLLVTACTGGAVSAQGWTPQRHVELVVPGGAGGSLDGTARTLHRLWNELKLLPVTSMVINRPGGSHFLAYDYVRQRKGDPHFLGLSTTMLLSAHIGGHIPFTYTDVTPIAFLLTEYVAFAVRADSPINTGRDMVEALKKDPESLSFGMGAARGGTYHIALGLPLQSVGVNARSVKTAFFAGGTQFTQLLGGHVDVAVGGMVLALPHVESGKLRVIAISAPKRIGGVLAAVPTWEELGFKATFGSQRSIFAPKAITAEQVAFWENVLRRVVESEEFRKSAERNQWDATFKGATDTRRLVEAQYEQLKSVMTYLGLAKQ